MVSLKRLEAIGRLRLSPSFFLRDFLHSEIAQVEGLVNVPDNLDLALAAGRGLCEHVLEPLQDALGRISIRSGYRSSEVNRVGNTKRYNCSNNVYSRTRHIWDEADDSGAYGATACVVVNSFVDYYDATGDWPALAWWIHDHIPAYRDMTFYRQLAAFNINWYSGAVVEQKIAAQVANPATGKRGILARTGDLGFDASHREFYRHWRGTQE
ncbi:MAG: peptidase M15 [Pseudomonadota bacterium]